jgi:tetratricopeptide (TPR) repeat protein
MGKAFTSILCGVVVVAAASVSAQEHAQHQHEEAVPERLGRVSFDTFCQEGTAAGFNRAVALLHSFAFRRAIEGFERVLQQDPACGVAAWGIALATWGNPFAGIKGAPVVEKGQAAAARARSIGAKTERERAYISAVETLYAGPDHPARVAAYARAMSSLAQTYPDDQEAQIFNALASLQTAAPTDKTYAVQLRAGAVLEALFAKAPDHPGLAHYIIHAYDVPPLAPRALDAARRYAQIAPSAPHALHMPSHTFTRVGYWRDSVSSNRASAAAARAEGATAEEFHAMDYLAYAYLQLAQDQNVQALAAKVHDMRAALSAPAAGGSAAPVTVGAFASAAIPARLALERGDWPAATAIVPVDDPFLPAVALGHFARGLGAARLGRTEAAKTESAALATLRDRLESTDPYWSSQVEIQRQSVDAWIAWAEGRKDDALSMARSASDAEDATEKAAVTPGPLAPARELLGEMLLEAGKPAEAREAFEAVLTREPHRFRSEYGAGLAAERAGDRAGAAAHYRALVSMCEGADQPERDALKHARAFVKS